MSTPRANLPPEANQSPVDMGPGFVPFAEADPRHPQGQAVYAVREAGQMPDDRRGVAVDESGNPIVFPLPAINYRADAQRAPIPDAATVADRADRMVRHGVRNAQGNLAEVANGANQADSRQERAQAVAAQAQARADAANARAAQEQNAAARATARAAAARARATAATDPADQARLNAQADQLDRSAANHTARAARAAAQAQRPAAIAASAGSHDNARGRNPRRAATVEVGDRGSRRNEPVLDVNGNPVMAVRPTNAQRRAMAEGRVSATESEAAVFNRILERAGGTPQQRRDAERAARRTERAEEITALNERADIAIYGSRGRTVYDDHGNIIADADHLIAPRATHILNDPRYGRTEADRRAVAERYMNDIDRLTQETADGQPGLDLAQAYLLAERTLQDHARGHDEHGHLSTSYVDELAQQMRANGVPNAAAAAQARYERVAGIRERLVREHDIFTEEEYQDVRAERVDREGHERRARAAGFIEDDDTEEPEAEPTEDGDADAPAAPVAPAAPERTRRSTRRRILGALALAAVGVGAAYALHKFGFNPFDSFSGNEATALNDVAAGVDPSAVGGGVDPSTLNIDPNMAHLADPSFQTGLGGENNTYIWQAYTDLYPGKSDGQIGQMIRDNVAVLKEHGWNVDIWTSATDPNTWGISPTIEAPADQWLQFPDGHIEHLTGQDFKGLDGRMSALEYAQKYADAKVIDGGDAMKILFGTDQPIPGIGAETFSSPDVPEGATSSASDWAEFHNGERIDSQDVSTATDWTAVRGAESAAEQAAQNASNLAAGQQASALSAAKAADVAVAAQPVQTLGAVDQFNAGALADEAARMAAANAAAENGANAANDAAGLAAGMKKAA